MQNNKEILNELELEEKMEGWSEAEKFIARRVYKADQKLSKIESRVLALEDTNKKALGFGAFGGFLIGLGFQLYNWLKG